MEKLWYLWETDDEGTISKGKTNYSCEEFKKTLKPCVKIRKFSVFHPETKIKKSFWRRFLDEI